MITSSLEIILYIARQDDKRERLRQLGVTGVMVNFLTSPDMDCRAVIKRLLIQKGALPMLMDRVWEADSDDSQHKQGRSPQVYRHHFCFMEDEMDEAIDALVKVARDAGGQLYVLIDEAGPPKLFPKFCRQLVSRVPTVHLWATALEHGLRPACLTEDETRDEHGNVTSQASGLVRGLRARGVPVQVVRRLDPDDVIRDVALAISNKVTVADYTMVAGLERRLVVGMGAEGFCSYSDMLAMSRSSGHLLWIEKAKAEKMKKNE
nr:hypothetical protein BaRGS_027596 [Batillaria attramentaria]